MLRACLPVFLCVGCVPAVVGEGDIDRETVSVDAFSAVHSDGIDIEVRAGDAFEVIFQSDENILPYLHGTVKGDTLTLSVEKDVLLYPTELVAYVISPDLDAITIRDGADLKALELDSEALDIASHDDGDVELAGTVANLTTDIAGKGDFEAQDLTASEVDFVSEGSGEAWLTVTESLRLTLLGSGKVNVYGNPAEREVDASGSGEVLYY